MFDYFFATLQVRHQVVFISFWMSKELSNKSYFYLIKINIYIIVVYIIRIILEMLSICSFFWNFTYLHAIFWLLLSSIRFYFTVATTRCLLRNLIYVFFAFVLRKSLPKTASELRHSQKYHNRRMIVPIIIK